MPGRGACHPVRELEQRYCIIVLAIARSVQERNWLVGREVAKLPENGELTAGLELLVVAPPELLPSGWIVVEPPAQLVAGGEVT